MQDELGASSIPQNYGILAKEHGIIPVSVEKIHPDAKIPTRGTIWRAYYDIYSIEDVDLTPEKVFMVHTGLKVQPKPGWFIDIRPRSGLAKEGITINNSPGTLDCDYGGELIVELIWHIPAHDPEFYESNERNGEKITWYNYNKHTSFMIRKIKKGDRIAQLCVMPMYWIDWIEKKVEGTAGFGSTGR